MSRECSDRGYFIHRMTSQSLGLDDGLHSKIIEIYFPYLCI